MKTNVTRESTPVLTHEGAPAKRITSLKGLRRSVLSTMLWEDQFYEDGVSIVDRIVTLVPKVKPEEVAALALEARTKFKLRHVPLLLTRVMAALPTHRGLVRETLKQVIQRPDELAEFLAIYWKDKRCPLSNQVREGLAAAFTKFDEYGLAKYNWDGAIKLRDVLFLVHAKPKDKAQGRLWKKLIEGKLKTPDTWEVGISACKTEAEKKKEWTRLLKEGLLGPLALLRNLRNMLQAGVAVTNIKAALDAMKVDRVLPFRFVSAARYAPQLEADLEKAMLKCLSSAEKLPGKTVLLLDVSGSMKDKVSGKSEISRMDAGCALAILLREICADVRVFTFSDYTKEVPARRGFALRDAIVASQPHSSTQLGQAVVEVSKSKYDRLIVVTDEQSHDPVGAPLKGGYMVNVASYRNGVGYGVWTHIDGWSEAVLDFIREYEKESAE